MKKHQKLLLVIALPMALWFFSERFFFFNYYWMRRVNAVVETYESGDNRTDNN